MRTSTIVTISLPPAMAKQAKKIAKQQQMTNSELVRVALRQFMEERDAEEAIRIYKAEKRAGTLKTLKGSLTDLMG
ncbi:MAG: CopG-like protein transcriptional regulator [Parcubacteria group bacterium GW2011_GWA2_53_21]|nr:MAG: CopG-like protein transcriptional regulator [Parcubacteria group bacterium GW2011_GWA2_53_21]